MSKPEDLLSLKVLRLSQPSFALNTNIDYLSGQSNELFPFSDSLKLPLAFGSIYLGETFMSIISINNQSNGMITDIGLKLELQAGSFKVVLIDTLGTLSPAASASSLVTYKNDRVSLKPNESKEFNFAHEIKDLGPHVLVSSVHFTLPSGERTYFRKMFKFNALNPMAVKSKVNSLGNDVLLEVLLCNLTEGDVVLERVEYDPNPLFYLENLSCTTGVFETPMAKGDTRQYLFKLSPIDLAGLTAVNLGKLELVWRSFMGSVGRLQTAQLSRKMPVISPFLVKVLSVGKAQVEKPFKVKLQIRNATKAMSRINIVSSKVKMGPVMLMGSSDTFLGNLAAGAFVEFDLTFFCLDQGLHSVTGFCIQDAIAGQKKDIESLFEVFVIS